MQGELFHFIRWSNCAASVAQRALVPGCLGFFCKAELGCAGRRAWGEWDPWDALVGSFMGVFAGQPALPALADLSQVTESPCPQNAAN